MKICLINNLYKPYARGGAERVVEMTAEELLKLGQEVVVISTKPINKFSIFPSAIKDGAVINYQLPSLYPDLNKIPKALRLFWHILDMFDIGSFFIVRKILKKEKVDLAITHNLKGVGYLMPLAIRSLGIKHIHILHDIQLLHPSGLMIYGKEKKVESIFARIYARICRLLFGSPDKVASPSQWLLDLHIKRGFFKNSETIVTPLFSFLTPPKRKGEYEEKKEEGKFTFLYVGQIEEHKGILFLIKAFKKFLKDPSRDLPLLRGGESRNFLLPLNKGENKRGFQLLIVGDGSKMDEACRLAGEEKNIKFIGRKSIEEIREIMTNSHCLIVPSLCYENSPTVIHEAFNAGLPVIGANLGGIPELIDDDNLLFKAKDENDLIEKIKWAIQNRN